MSKNVVAIIQARMNSERLPGKVLKKILDKPLLFYLTERINKCKMVDKTVIATSENYKDNSIVEFCEKNDISFYRGSEDNVLLRFKEAAIQNSADIVVRICADSPLLDNRIVDQVITEFIEYQDKYDYISNSIDQTYPLGMNVEVFSMNSLIKANQLAKSNFEMEHVTPCIRNQHNSFKIKKKDFRENLFHIRLTVDEKSDFDLIKIIIENLYPKNKNFSLEDILSFLKKNKELLNINRDINQRHLESFQKRIN